MTIAWVFGILSLLVAAGLFFGGRGKQRNLEAMSAADTYTADLLGSIHRDVVGSLGAEAFQQVCEVNGMIEHDEPLQAPLSRTDCVAFTYTVTREYEEQVEETDNDGNQTTTTRRGSEQVEQTEQRVPFWVRDSTGRVLVDPEGAKLDLIKTSERYDEDEDRTRRNGRRTLGYTMSEKVLAPGRTVYVLGCAVDRQGQPVLARHPNEPKQPFLVSLRSERELSQQAESGSRTMSQAAIGLAVLGVLLVIVALVT